MVPLAPARLSSIADWSNVSVRFCAIVRAGAARQRREQSSNE
jgi:hypothetical protein